MPVTQSTGDDAAGQACGAACAAMAALERGELGAARCWAERALEIDGGDSASAWAEAHRCLALVHWRKDELAPSLHHFSEEARLLGQMPMPDMRRLLAARDSMALLHYKLGRFGVALKLREETLSLAEAEPAVSPVQRRRLERRLAQSLQQEGARNEAERRYARCKPAPDDPYDDHVGWLNAVALLAEQRGDMAAAASRYEDLVVFLEGHGEREGHDEALANAILAGLELSAAGRVASLLRRLRRSVRAGGRASGRLRLLDVRFLLLANRSRFAAAAAVAERAETLMRSLVGPEHEALLSRAAMRAAMLRGSGRVAEAKALLEARLPAEPTPAATAGLVELGEMLVAEGAYAQGLQKLELALAGEAGQDFAEARWRTLLALSEAAHAQDRPKASLLLGKMALEPVREAANGLTGEDRGGWMRNRAAAYDRVLDRLVLASRLPEATVLQLRRMQETSREIGFRRPELDGMLAPVPYRPGEKALKARYDELQRTLAPRAHARNEVGNWLAQVFAQDFDASAPFAHPTSGGTSLWFFADKDCARAVLTDAPGVVQDYPIPMTPEELARGVRALRDAVLQRSDDWMRFSQRLHQAVFGAVSSDLGALRRLDLVAPGLFAFLPFAALHDGRSLLVERFELAVRTGQRGRSAAPCPPAQWRAAAFGASTGGNSLEPLPGIRDELASLAALPGLQCRLDADFSAEALREELGKAPQLVHLAGHFHFRPAQPHLSTLALGDGTELPVAALAGIEYDFSGVELLVLAACDTGLSDSLDIGIESLAGLAQAKGAATVLASMWPVPDTGTAQLLSRFYSGLLAQPRADAPAALAAAQRAMIGGKPALRQGASARRGGGIGGGGRSVSAWHPLDWAGFAAFVAEPSLSTIVKSRPGGAAN